MKGYGVGAILSTGLAVLLCVINAQFYANVMKLTLPIVFLMLHVLAYRHYLLEKRYGTYTCFVLTFAITVFFSLPALTQQQAELKAANQYGLDHVEASTVPVTDSWNPFDPHAAYFFKGNSPTEGELYLFVSSKTGNVHRSEP